MSNNEGKGYDYWVDRCLGIFFSGDKTRLYLLLIFAIGFILRLIAAINLSVSADDMHFSVHAINFLNSGKLVVYDQSAALWYYATDIFYKFFGVGQVASRLAALIFGSFSILIMFFLVKEVFEKKIAFIASFLLAISPFHIKYTISEMDNMAMFFVLFSMLVFMIAIKNSKNNLFAVSGILLGLGIFTKVYTLLFIPVFLAYAFYYNKKEKGSFMGDKIIKKLLFFLLAVFIFTIPSLTHNYLLYKDKGFTDLIYANALEIGKDKAEQYYSWDSGWGHGADWKGFFGIAKSVHTGDEKLPSSFYPFKYIWKNDPIVLLFGILGLILLFLRKKKEYVYIFVFVLIFVFSYLAARILLAKHYIFLLLFLIPPAAYLISGIDYSIKRKFIRFRTRYILIILILSSLFMLGINAPFAPASYYTKSEVAQVMEFKETNIPSSSLIVADSRIYRGQIHWMFHGREYIEANLLSSLLSASNKTKNTAPVDVYYVECVVDDCGWGTVKDQPDFNSSMEQITDFFSSQGKLQEEIYSSTFTGKYYPFISGKGKLHFRIYKAILPIDPSLYPQLKSQKIWFLYPIGYDESISIPFDKYSVNNRIDELLDKLAHLIVYISIVLAFISLISAAYLFLELK